MTGNPVQIVDEVKNLKRKTAMQQYCHYELSARILLISRVLDVSLVLLSGTALFATTVHADILLVGALDDESQRRLSAFLSFIVFLLMLLRLVLRLADIAAAFHASGNAYTRMLRKLDMTLTTLDGLSSSELGKLGAQLTDEYTIIADQARPIPKGHFLRLKQEHLQQIEISRELDSNPFRRLCEIEHNLTNRQANGG